MSPSRKAKLFDPIPSRGFQDILKRRLLALCSDIMKLRNFPKHLQDLATIDVLRDIDYPSCANLGTSFAYMYMRIRVPLKKTNTAQENIYIRRGLQRCRFKDAGNAKASKTWNDNSRTPRFFYMPKYLTTNPHSWEFLCDGKQYYGYNIHA